MNMLLISIFVGVVSAVVATEVLDWSEKLSQWLVKRNARYTPSKLRDRLTEEWLAELPQIPGKFSRLIWAADLRRGAYIISSRWHLPNASPMSVFAVRCADFTISLALIIFLLPLYLLFAILLTVYNFRSGNKCSLIERHVLIGYRGQKIRMLRFKTQPHRKHVDGMNMAVDSSLVRFLRISGLDDIPVLFNVLSGDVSLVGPRARYIYETLDDKASISGLNNVKPGVISLSHMDIFKSINGELTGFNENEIDVFFTQNYSLMLYTRVLWAALKRIFFV